MANLQRGEAGGTVTKSSSHRFLWYFLIAVALTLIVALLKTAGFYWIDRILLIPFLVGVLASGNPHQPNEIVSWLALAVCFFLVTWLFGAVAGKIGGRGRGSSQL